MSKAQAAALQSSASTSSATPVAEKPKSKTRRKPRSSKASASAAAGAAPVVAPPAPAISSNPSTSSEEKEKKQKKKEEKGQVKGKDQKVKETKDGKEQKETKASPKVSSAPKDTQTKAQAQAKGPAEEKPSPSSPAPASTTNTTTPTTATTTKRKPRTRARKSRSGDGALASTEDKALGMNALKAQIRQTKRFLARPNVAQDKLQESQRRLVALERALQQRSQGEKERGNASRYHKIRFFERQKLVRRIKQLEKELKAFDEGAGSEVEKAKRGIKDAQLKEARVLLNYVLHYPLTQKYISLFPLAQIASTADEGTHDVLSLFVHSLVQPPTWLLSDPNRLSSWSKAKQVRDEVLKRMEEGEIGDRPEEDVDEMGSAGVRGAVLKDKGGKGVKRKVDEGEQDEKDETAVGEGEKEDAEDKAQAVGNGEKRRRRRRSKASAGEAAENNAGKGQNEAEKVRKAAAKGLQDDEFFAMEEDDE